MWSDNDTRIDFIDFQPLVNSVISIVSNDNLLPCTIGLYGDWGSGKSSLMQMIEAHFEEKEKVLTIKFNGWLFEGYEDAKTVLMGTILDELIKKRTLTAKGKKLASKLLKKIDWMKLATAGIKSGLGFLALGPVGLSLGAIESGDVFNKLSELDYEEYLNEDSNEKENKSLRMGIREFHKDFSDLLKETRVAKLIVFIDDLDRCNPNTVIDTLEAIKLFLFVENSAFIIGADERLIKYAVKKRFPEISGNERFEVGRDYLEKLIQFPIRIPQLSQSEMETYINLLFTNLSLKDPELFEKIRIKALQQKSSTVFSTGFHISNLTEIIDGIEMDDNIIDQIKESLTLSAKITPILTRGLNGNPRQSKRFLNTLLLRIIMADSKKVELERRILAKLMILEYFKPELFKALSGMQVKEEGKPKVIRDIEVVVSADIKADDKSKKNIPELSTESENWLSDDEIKEWFKTEPLLTEIDLRPYFYFSRDTLGSIPAVVQRMSPKAQEIYGLLIAGSKTERNKGLEKLSSISEANCAAIFEVVSKEFHEKGQTSDGESYLNILIQICEKRIELIPQLFMFLKTISHKKIKPVVLPKLISAVRETEYRSSLIDCLEGFKKSDNKRLAKLAENNLLKFES